MGTSEKLSPARRMVPVLPGLKLIHRGKVRDTYVLDSGYGLLLVVATDGLSIFDFVLDTLVPEKGAILTATNHFWIKKLEKDLDIKTHFVAAGRNIDQFLPEELQGNRDLQSRAMVVRKLHMDPIEYINRACLTGSGLTGYKETGTVCGHQLQLGLQDGDELLTVIDTPTTKADVGHDEPLDAALVREQYPEGTALAHKTFGYIRDYAKSRGIVVADGKSELGRDSNGVYRIGDEVGTPDACRFWELATWRTGRLLEQRKAPPPYDKQLVRQWGIEQSINKLDPSNPEHVAQVHAMHIPPNLTEATTKTYRYIFWRLTGMRLEQYQREMMGITVEDKPRRLTIVFGSENDLNRVGMELGCLARGHYDFAFYGRPQVHILSCHRNPDELFDFACTVNCRARMDEVIVAAGGKAFALPGMLKTLLRPDIPVIGVAFGALGSRALDAAQLSISELPDQSVVMDEENGGVYTNNTGFLGALERAAHGEFPPPKRKADKQAQFDIDLSRFV